MTMHDLIEKLKERPKTVDEHRDEQRREWIQSLDALFTAIEGWLAPGVSAEVLSMQRTENTITERDLGEYAAPELHISDGRLSVRLTPVAGRVTGVVVAGGKRLLGLRGRVDLVCGPIRIPLVRTTEKVWRALPLCGEPRDLNEESFAEILGEVLLDD
jgi:hypothetical protein